MSFPKFKDFDSSVTDLIEDDFDIKYSLKIKSAAPQNLTVTTNTAVSKEFSSLVPKLSFKWAHNSGFTLEKLEISPDCKMTVETSLTGVTKGLKLEFKGNDSTDKADLSMKYSLPQATITADVDISNFSSAKASVSSGHGPISAGASLDLKIAKSSIESTVCGVGVGYTLEGTGFVGLRANKNFASYSVCFDYTRLKDITFAGNLTYAASKPSAVLAAQYKCNPNTTIKAKASSEGVLGLSVKQNFEKKFSVIGSASVPSGFNGIKFGLNATLG
jgi:hypothetical protein